MGEYYKPCILSSKSKTAANKTKVIAYVSPWDFGNGCKQMEFGYINNSVMNALESLICRENGIYANLPIALAGDYDNNEPYTFMKNTVNLYDLCNDELTDAKSINEDWLRHRNIHTKHYRYIINEDKMEFIDTNKIKGDKYGYKIHPIAILCCNDVAKGCGCYRGLNEDKVGLWARDVVVVSDERPTHEYKEVFYEFEEC